jgi:xanthine dehydrogenase accessory factor
MQDFWPRVEALLAAGQPVFIALVVDHTSGSPGTRGARMLVTPDGTSQGTIGGGAMEFQTLALARQALADGIPTTLRELWHREDAPGERSGMICSGRQTNLYRLCTPDDDGAAVARAARLAGTGRAGRLRIDARGITVTEAEPDLARPTMEVCQDEDAWWYEEELLNLKRIAIVGGGHCGQALARLMRQLGYEVAVFDRRKDIADGHGCHQVVARYEDAGPAIIYPEVTRVVVMTTDYPSDVAALAGVLPRGCPFVGVMGSGAKISRIRHDLRARGFTDSQLASLRAPVGLRIHSHTPDEIAVSIAAELIREAPRLPG